VKDVLFKMSSTNGLLFFNLKLSNKLRSIRKGISDLWVLKERVDKKK
jgi:hypothetical protein